MEETVAYLLFDCYNFSSANVIHSFILKDVIFIKKPKTCIS